MPDEAEATSTTHGDSRAIADAKAASSRTTTTPAADGEAAASPQPERKPRRPRRVSGSVAALRTRLATVIWLLAVLAALVLAIGALFVALKFNTDNAIVDAVLHAARAIDFGQFKTFKGHDHLVKEALVNWGLAAVIYLVAGKILDRIIRPSS